MSTPGMQWANLMSSMLGEQTSQALQKRGLDQHQQQIDMQQQEQQRRAQAADNEFAEHMQKLGATPIVNGVVKRQLGAKMPDSEVGNVKMPGAEVPGILLDKPDPNRVVNWKASDGTPIAFELPSLADQIRTQWAAQAPVREGQVQQERATAQAHAEGSAAGQSAGRQADLAARGVELPADLAEYYKLPAGLKVLPEQLQSISGHYASVERAKVVTDAAGERQKNAIGARKALEEAKQQFAAEQNRIKLGYQDKWARARAAISAASASTSQGSLNTRLQIRQFDASAKQHSAILDQVYKEQQKQIAAQPLLDEKATGDGEEFMDPWLGKNMTMNYAQRLRIRNALKASEEQINTWTKRAGEIEQKYIGGGQQQPAGGGGQQQQGGVQKFKVGDTVESGGKRYRVKGYSANGKLLAEPI